MRKIKTLIGIVVVSIAIMVLFTACGKNTTIKKISKVNIYDSEYHIAKIVTYNYDKNGILDSYESYDNDSQTTIVMKNTGEKNNENYIFVNTDELIPDYKNNEHTETEINTKDFLTKEFITYDSDGNEIRSTTFEYDDYGLIIKFTTKDEGYAGEFVYTYDYVFSDDGKIQEAVVHSESQEGANLQSFRYVFEYDSDGYLIRLTGYDEDNVVNYIREIKY